MPEISRFLGIVIAMYYADHNPPHFHAKYGDYEALIDIETGGSCSVVCLAEHFCSCRSGTLCTGMS